MWWDELNDADYAPTFNAFTPKDTLTLHYNSITSRRPILNAITGEYYFRHVLDSTGSRSPLKHERDKKVPYRMGSCDEGRFYVVIQGEPGNPKESCKLFFDSPEQYERFTGIEVCATSKTAFLERKKAFGMVHQYEMREKEEFYGNEV